VAVSSVGKFTLTEKVGRDREVRRSEEAVGTDCQRAGVEERMTATAPHFIHTTRPGGTGELAYIRQHDEDTICSKTAGIGAFRQ